MKVSTEQRFWMKVDKSDDCWIWIAAKLLYGYGRFTLYNPESQKQTFVLAHRFAWQLTHGPIPSGLNVLHKCDNPPCVNPFHLFLGTQGDNTRDRETKGRGNHPRGENHHKVVLTIDQVKDIKNQLAVGVKPIRLAEQYNVNRGTISCIISKRSWKY